MAQDASLGTDLRGLVRLLGRHWLILIIALTAAAGAVIGVALKVPITYSSTALVLLLPPRAGGAYQALPKGAPTVSPKLYNPYLSFDSSLFVLVKVISQDAMTQQVKDQLQTEGASARYVATASGDLPAVNITVTDQDRVKITKTMSAVVAYAVTDLATRQRDAGVPQETWATATSGSMAAITETSDKAKALLVVAGLGLVAAISLVFIAESLTGGRPRRIEKNRPAPIRWSSKEKAAAGPPGVGRGSEAWLSADAQQASSPPISRPDDPLFPSRAGEPGF